MATMFYLIMSYIFAIILLHIFHTHSQQCIGSPRTMLGASSIQSNILYEYLGLLDCHVVEVFDEWQACAAECMKNSTCVGIQPNSPCAICFLSNITHTGPLIIDDYFLIIEDLKEFECKLFYILVS